ncbi:MAG: class I SAM-dependent methyltransferase [Verrucomicrobiota bacterium]|nr:class I SAM-dependent methyltransferase [Verrucomicrobiota bacterium]
MSENYQYRGKTNVISLPNCWVCNGTEWKVFKESTLNGNISPEDFRITDSHYGHTARIDECTACGFKQCTDLSTVLNFYENLEDPEYNKGREQRGLQSRKILESLVRYKTSGQLLDIGAASGILIEQAEKLGFHCIGIEPSRSLAQAAIANGFNVRLGTFPHESVRGPFDIITLVDVLEHVPHPGELLKNIANHLSPTGFGVLTTPNVESWMARFLKSKWWHFRVAHIGYFSPATLTRLMESADLEIIETSSPPWYFTMEYAAERAQKYFPSVFHFKLPHFLRERTIRVNFFDSMQVIFRRKSS